jgi:hypothetical protein
VGNKILKNSLRSDGKKSRICQQLFDDDKKQRRFSLPYYYFGCFNSISLFPGVSGAPFKSSITGFLIPFADCL